MFGGKHFLLRTGDFVVENTTVVQTHQRRVETGELSKLRLEATLPWPEVESPEIDDHSKADCLVKEQALAVWKYYSATSTDLRLWSPAVSCVPPFPSFGLLSSGLF